MSLKIVCKLVNSADSDEMQYHVAFYLGLTGCQSTYLPVSRIGFRTS